ncbi:MAG: PQQ-binding-like beta-propeller repeat protein [Candidatus Bathyarchaeia archaeon]
MTTLNSTVSAQDDYIQMPDRVTKTEVAVTPTLVGLGQEVLINIMTYPAPNGPTYEAQSLVPGLTGGFSNITITITHPDGTKETFMPIDETLEQCGISIPGQAQIVGHLQFRYKPTAVGNYSLSASFPGETYTTDNQSPVIKAKVYYKPSSSTFDTTFAVQEEIVLAGQLNGYPWSPLPNDYWENPVSTNNREWYAISGDWVQDRYNVIGTNYNPYSTAPNSPHILWANQVWSSGLIGGDWGSLPYASGVAGAGGIVLDGKIYQQSAKSGYFDCIDLRTGELLWSAPGSINKAQRLDPAYQTATQQNEGAIDEWIWGYMTESRTGGASPFWIRYSPWDGSILQNITNVPRDITSIKVDDGSPIVWINQANLNTYNTSQPLKLSYANLIKWNYSKLVDTVGYAQITSNDWRKGIEWNVTTQVGDLVDVGDNNFRGPTCIPYWEAGVVVVRTPNAMQQMEAFDMDTGALLWKNNNTVFDIDVQIEGIATSSNGPVIKCDGGSGNFVAYDVKTGKEIWRASTGEDPWGMLPAYTFVYHDGVHFMGSYDGHVYAYNTHDGSLVWQSDYIGQEFESVYNNQPFNGRAAGADGKLYYSTDTTYRAMPRTRFHTTVCINETTGEFIWKLPIGIQPTAIADGYLVGRDSDNGMQYVIGKGQTTTSVTAPTTGITLGTSVLIQGSVLDQSPGSPNTPAVADEDMSVWMDYLYGQNATLINSPPSPKGVEVRLYAISSDGSVTEIGATTSDSSGKYAIEWAPQKADLYKITATFDGSESYYGSWDETALSIKQGAETTPTSSALTLDAINSLVFTNVAILGIIIVLVIVIVGVLLLRKR